MVLIIFCSTQPTALCKVPCEELPNRDNKEVVVTKRLERSNGGDAIGERRHSIQRDAPSLAVDGKLKSSNNNNMEYGDTRSCFGKEGENCRKKKTFLCEGKNSKSRYN